MARNGGLSEKQRKAIGLLFAGVPRQEVVEATGCGYRTLERWCGQELFTGELERLQDERDANLVGFIGAHVIKAYNVLGKNLDSEDETEARKSAVAILNRAGHGPSKHVKMDAAVSSTVRAEPDLSKLTTEQLKQLRDLHIAAKGE